MLEEEWVEDNNLGFLQWIFGNKTKLTEEYWNKHWQPLLDKEKDIEIEEGNIKPTLPKEQNNSSETPKKKPKKRKKE